MFICMQKINFITHFFLAILQRNSRLVISGDLGMPGHTRLKWQYQIKETFDVYLQAKNQLHPHPLRFPWDIAKYWKLVVLGTLGMPGYALSKWYFDLVENVCVYLQAKKINFTPMLFWRDCKDMKTYFG